MNYYYCTSNGRMHLWSWLDFKESIKGRIIEYNAKGHIVKYIIYQVENEIDDETTRKYDIICRKLDDEEVIELLKKRKERKGEL